MWVQQKNINKYYLSLKWWLPISLNDWILIYCHIGAWLLRHSLFLTLPFYAFHNTNSIRIEATNDGRIFIYSSDHSIIKMTIVHWHPILIKLAKQLSPELLVLPLMKSWQLKHKLPLLSLPVTCELKHGLRVSGLSSYRYLHVDKWSMSIQHK